MNPKDQLAEIEKGCGKCNYICHKCKGKLSEDIMGKKCPYCSEWTYYCNEFKGLCNECQTAKRYFLLGTISQLKEEEIFLEDLEDECEIPNDSRATARPKIYRRIDKLTADLKLYEDKLKEMGE